MTDEYRRWSAEQRFESLLEQLAPLDLGGWRMAEVSSVLGGLGWRLLATGPNGGQADPVRGRLEGVRWRLDDPPGGPRQGVGVVAVDEFDADQAISLEFNLSYGIRYSDAVEFVQTAWELTEDILGAPPMVCAGPGPTMLWRRPGTSLAVRLHGDSAIMAMLNTTFDNDAAGLPHGIWRAAAPIDLRSPEPRPTPPRTWERVRTQLAIALRALCTDAPRIPAEFILHLQSGRDRLRRVSAWNDGVDLWIEASDHGDPMADPDRFVQFGWPRADLLCEQRFPNALRHPEHADTAATMLVNAIESMGVKVDDLAYQGTVTGRRLSLELELPDLALLRVVDPDD
ncbi:hypothetical protein [Embleya sp. MST-111070]|uniref:hypothetical protein n=1 Tax=Embleya sp. MST-111070 TaxID=3398231 RepID=UPI003F7326A8